MESRRAQILNKLLLPMWGVPMGTPQNGKQNLNQKSVTKIVLLNY